ncbi:MAG: hypothetical protein CMK71_00880 [Pseudomonadaceae bacterium]|nr:hypothetical protein [Pseudomonadaceae bacterium]
MQQFFKYLPQPRNIFSEGFIRLTQSSALNDPFEAAHCHKSLDILVSYFDEENAYDYEEGECSYRRFIDKNLSKVGVISLSATKDNLLMWAHYADEHRGVVVGVAQFDIEQPIFESLFSAEHFATNSLGIDSYYDGIPRPVSYKKGLRYKNDMFEHDYGSICEEGGDRLLYEIFMQKSDEWVYEQEYRVVLRLEQADRVIVDNINDIENEEVRDLLRQSKFSKARRAGKKQSSTYTIDLYKIKDIFRRQLFGKVLAKLGSNAKNIYLMRLDSSCINSCYIGLRSSVVKSMIEVGYASSTGYLDIRKAEKNSEYYNLEFEEI